MTKKFQKEEILRVRQALKDDAGDDPCETTNLAYEMLSELLSMKHSDKTLYNMFKNYFGHPHTVSKTKKKAMRKVIRERLAKLDDSLLQ
jgi:hypothetical protein